MSSELCRSSYWPKLVKGLRATLRLSQTQFSDRLGIDQATVSRWERGQSEPQYEIRRALEEMAKASGLATLNDMSDAVSVSPFPMVLVDSRGQIVAASMSSGFQPDRSALEQTPEIEQAFSRAFDEQLSASRFWDGLCPRFDYEFRTETEVRRAIVSAVTDRGEVFALVQKTW